MEKKITAVQWLLSKHPELGMLGDDIIEQVLQMEREQMLEASISGSMGKSFEEFYQTYKP